EARKPNDFKAVEYRSTVDYPSTTGLAARCFRPACAVIPGALPGAPRDASTLTATRRETDHRGRGTPPNHGGSGMNIQAKTNKPQAAVMNAVHDLPVLVARDKGFFKDEGLDLDFVTTPGMAQATTTHLVKFDSIFDRPLDSVYNDGGIDQYRMCEWGIMKRA